MNKLVLFAAVVSLGAQASASFDLMYIPVLSENRVARYDPVNRVFLGGFNVPSPRRVMSGNEQLGVVRAGPGSYRFNMFTGAQIGYIGFETNTASYNRNNANLVSSSLNGMAEINIATGSNSTTTLTGLANGAAFATNRFATGQIATFRNDLGTLRSSFHASNGSLISLGPTLTINSSGVVSNSIQWFNRAGSEIITTAYFDLGTSSYRLVHLTRSVGGFLSTSLSSSVAANFANTQPVSLAPAHNGFYVVGADLTSPTTLTRISQFDDDGSGFFYDSWTVNLNVSGNPSFGVGMVVAPEPGTMIALGAGVLALLKRRRKV